MLKVKKMNMDPPSGWIAQMESGLVIKAGTWRKLILKIHKHIEVNSGSIPENLEEIIMHELCLLNPESICEGDGPKRFFPSRKEMETGTKKLLDARAEMRKSDRDPFVSQEIAEERAAECFGCEMKRNLWGCFVCDQLVKLVTRTYGKQTSLDRDLYGCGVCGCINSAQVHLQDFVLAKTASADSIPDYPPCWKRKALENIHGRTTESTTEQPATNDGKGSTIQEPDKQPETGKSDLSDPKTGTFSTSTFPSPSEGATRRSPPIQSSEKEIEGSGMAQ